MAKKKDEELEAVPKEYACLLSCDGSAAPNPGPYGSGVHGYIYPLDSLGKTTGKRPTNYAITNIGYIFKDELDRSPYQNVAPEYYINGMYSFRGVGTNNLGEIQAFTMSLLNVLEITDINITKITVRTDSEYVMAIHKNVSNFDNVTWRERITKNVEYWEQMRLVVKEVKDRGIDLEVLKARGHSIELDNHNADRLAVMARMYSASHNHDANDFYIVPAKDYYTPGGSERHAFLRFKNLYFMGISNRNSKESVYSIMQYDKDTEPGRPSHEATFGLVALKTKQPMIEDLIEYYNKYLGSTALISSLDLDAAFNRTNLNLYSVFKEKIYNYDRYFSALKLRDEETIIKAIRPPGLANQAVERTALLYDIIDEYRHMDKETPSRKYIDITDSVYEKDIKGKTKIKIKNNEQYMVFDVNMDGTDIKIPVLLGKDCIGRDHLKQIENDEPVIKLVIKRMGEKFLNYYILVDAVATGDISVWCNFFSNNVILGVPEKKKKK